MHTATVLPKSNIGKFSEVIFTTVDRSKWRNDWNQVFQSQAVRPFTSTEQSYKYSYLKNDIRVLSHRKRFSIPMRYFTSVLYVNTC